MCVDIVELLPQPERKISHCRDMAEIDKVARLLSQSLKFKLLNKITTL